MKFSELAGLFEGKPVTIVAAGKTTVDYEAAVETDHVVLINHAIRLVSLFPSRCLFHVTLHPEVFGSYAQLALPNVTPVTGHWGAKHMPPEVAAKALYFGTWPFPSNDDSGLGPAARDASTCLARNVVCHVHNSSQCAIHFTWLLGCRRLRVVGACEFRGLPTSGYEDRLKVPAEYAAQETPAIYYIDSFRRFVGLLEWDEVRTLGY